MRITNQMMINSSISNIQVNKNQLNTLSTELSTQKKISKPSDDPIIAIRALRLRSSLDEVTQYLGKNIPDASSWLSVTHDALDEGYNIVSDLYRYCVQGSTDSYSESERNTLAESLQKLVEAFYSEGNVDYAGRYVFTGHATDKPLTYQSDDTAKDVDYTITQNFTRDNLLTVSYTDVIIDFNPTLIGSSLQAKYILFEDKHPGYNHLCIGCTTKGNYVESFFYQPSDRYIVNQNTCAVEMVQIYDTNGRLFFEDRF